MFFVACSLFYDLNDIMFSKLKQFKDLRDQAKTMQNALAEETITVDKGGIKIVMDGNMHVMSVSIKEEMKNEEIEKRLANTLNQTIKETQKKMAMKMQQMGGFPSM